MRRHFTGCRALLPILGRYGCLVSLFVAMAFAPRIRAEHGVCGLADVCHFVADGVRAGCLRAGAIATGLVLAGHRGGHCRQYPRRSHHLVDGPRGQPSRKPVWPIRQSRAGAGLAHTPRAQGLLAVVAAGRGRPFVCGCRLAAPSVLAVRDVHGDRQMPALHHHDGSTYRTGAAVVSCERSAKRLARSMKPVSETSSVLKRKSRASPD